MLFDLNGASLTFQHMIEIFLSGLNLATCLCYLDDIIHANEFDQHCKRLAEVLTRFREYNLSIKISQIFVCCATGFILRAFNFSASLSPDPAKVVAVKNLMPRSTVKDVRSFLGFSGYYKSFVSRYATEVDKERQTI